MSIPKTIQVARRSKAGSATRTLRLDATDRALVELMREQGLIRLEPDPSGVVHIVMTDRGSELVRSLQAGERAQADVSRLIDLALKRVPA